jgi:hypothetical protein
MRPRSIIEPLESRIAPALVFAVDDANNLLTFDSGSPGTILSATPITGLASGVDIKAIDFRPATGELFALALSGTNAQIGTIAPDTGAFTGVGGTFVAAGTNYGFDFDPTLDRIRVVSDADINFSVDPATGTTTSQTALNPPDPNVVAAAYSNAFAGATDTKLYGIDSGTDMLVLQDPPADGTLFSRGPLTVDVSGVAGFDIRAGDATGFAALQVGGVSGLYSIDLSTGTATSLGDIGTGSAIVGLAVFVPVALFVNPTTATFLDADGDRVTVKVTKGTLGPANLRLVSEGAVGGAQLQLVDLSAAAFANTGVRITAARGPLGGDGLVHVGEIEAGANDLGAVVIDGDLGQIDAGDGDALLPAVKSLTTLSLGALGVFTQAPGGSLESNFNGQLGALAVKTNVKEAHINVINGGIDKITIGGSLIGGNAMFSGRIATTGDAGPVKIGGDLRGGDGEQSAHLFIAGKLASVTVGGSLIGEGAVSARIRSGLDMGPVKIAGDIRGGAGHDSGQVLSFAKLASVSVGGSIIGGKGGGFAAGSIFATGDLGAVGVKGDVIGGAISQNGSIQTDGALGKLTIGGSVIGGTAGLTGFLFSNVRIGPVSIGGSLIGGSGAASGELIASGPIATVFIGGSIVGGSGQPSGAIIAGSGAPAGGIGNVTIRGSVIGGKMLFTGKIQADGDIAKLSIGGSLLGGNFTESGTVTAAGTIGSIFIGHDVAGGNATGAGIVVGTGIIEAKRIGGVTIGGSLLAGEDQSTGFLRKSGAIIAEDDLGPVRIKGSIAGGVAPDGTITDALIVARGQPVQGVKSDIAIKSLIVGGSVERAQVLGGYVFDGAGVLLASNPDAQIGKITVGGNWTAGSIAAGVRTGTDGLFGTEDDVKNPGSDAALIVSKIAGIAIKGHVFGTLGGGDHFGFVAQQIDAFSIGGTKFPLLRGPHTDDLDANDPVLLVALTSDVRAHEVAA